MTTQKYTFKNTPKTQWLELIQRQPIFNDEPIQQWTRTVEDEINILAGKYLNTRWSLDSAKNELFLLVDVKEEDEVKLENMLKARYRALMVKS